MIKYLLYIFSLERLQQKNWIRINSDLNTIVRFEYYKIQENVKGMIILENSVFQEWYILLLFTSLSDANVSVVWWFSKVVSYNQISICCFHPCRSIPPPATANRRRAEKRGVAKQSPLFSWKPSREVLTRDISLSLSLASQISEKGQSHHGPRRLFLFTWLSFQDFTPWKSFCETGYLRRLFPTMPTFNNNLSWKFFYLSLSYLYIILFLRD